MQVGHNGRVRMSAKKIAIFGATGTAGTGVMHEMLAAGWDVHAVTRDPTAPNSVSAAQAGARLVQADLDDRASIRAAIEDVPVVYLSGPSLLSRWDIGQAVQGINVADACAEVASQHLIYQSATVGAARGVLGMGSKRAIEERIAELATPFTVLRPGLFMENLLTFFTPEVSADGVTVAMPLNPQQAQDLVSVRDIGRAAVTIASDPAQHAGQVYELVAQLMSLEDMAAAIGEVTGIPTRAMSIPLDVIAAEWPQGLSMFQWIMGRTVSDTSSILARLVSEPTDFRSWVRTTLVPRLQTFKQV